MVHVHTNVLYNKLCIVCNDLLVAIEPCVDVLDSFVELHLTL